MAQASSLVRLLRNTLEKVPVATVPENLLLGGRPGKLLPAMLQALLLLR